MAVAANETVVGLGDAADAEVAAVVVVADVDDGCELQETESKRLVSRKKWW